MHFRLRVIRGKLFQTEEIEYIPDRVQSDDNLAKLWERFKMVNFFVQDLAWGQVAAFDVAKIKEII